MQQRRLSTARLLARLRPLPAIALVLAGVLFDTGATAATLFHGFDVTDALVPAAELRPGGPPRDGIPALTDPRFVTADRASFLELKDRVLGVRVNGVAKAYPLAIMNWHEIVNDQFAGTPVTVTYCPLCFTGVAFSASIDGRRQIFGVSGLLYNSDVVLYDRASESLWSQLLGKAISGPRRGTNLQLIPTSNTTWSHWRERHPDTLVLSRDTGHRRDYDADPYGDYARSPELMFPVRFRAMAMHPKQPVLGIELDGQAVAYPLSELAQAGVTVDDQIGSVAVRIRYDAAHETAEISTADGTALPGVTSYWFAWYAFHPEGRVYRAPAGAR